MPPNDTLCTKNVMSSKPNKFTSKLLVTWTPKLSIVLRNYFKLFSLANAVVRFAAAPSKFPSSNAI